MRFILLTLSLVCSLFSKESAEIQHKDASILKTTTITMETTQGVMQFRLNPEIAPKACENMISLANKQYYDGTEFHRIIKDFMIQGGDPTGTGRGGTSIWNRPFEDECDPSVTFDQPGLLAMANAGPNTNGSQFFITTKKTPWLNGRHTIFGTLISGDDVLKKLESVSTDQNDRPLKKEQIIKLTVNS